MFSPKSIEDIAMEQQRDRLQQAEKAQLVAEALKNKAQNKDGRGIAGLFAAFSLKFDVPDSVDCNPAAETRC